MKHSRTQKIFIFPRAISNEIGFALTEIMVSVGLMSIVFLNWASISTMIANATQSTNTGASLESVRRLSLQALQSSVAMSNTIKDPTNAQGPLACVSSNTPCAVASGHQGFRLLDENGNLVVDGVSPTAGVTANGAPCTGYNAQNPTAACPYQYQLTWTPQCPTGQPNCVAPLMKIQGSFVLPATGKMNTSLNSSQFDFLTYYSLTPPHNYLVGYVVNEPNPESQTVLNSIQSWAGVAPGLDGNGIVMDNGYTPGVAPGVPAHMDVPILSFTGDGGPDQLWDMNLAANGGYDAYYNNMATVIASMGAPIKAVSIGVECNGNWFPWSVNTADHGINTSFANYIAAFRRIATIFRAKIPGVLIEWDAAWGGPYFNNGISSGTPMDYFPGAAYVDVVSMDFYENPLAPDWPTVQSGGTYNLDWLVSFARANGLKVALSEWGAANDDGTFITSAANWMNSLGSLFVYSDYSWYEPADQLWEVGTMPNEQAAWKAAWGK